MSAHRRRLTTVPLAAVAAATLILSVAHTPTALAAPPAATDAHGSSLTLTFVARDEPGNETLEDLGTKSAPGGPDLGDLLAFTQTLLRHGKSVGQVHVVAVGVDHRRHLSEATGTIDLSHGTIQVAGIVSQSPTFTLAVTGGTRAYASYLGTMTFDASKNTQTITLHLTRGR